MWLVKIKTSRGGKELLFSGNVIACNEEEGNKKGDNQKIKKNKSKKKNKKKPTINCTSICLFSAFGVQS